MLYGCSVILVGWSVGWLVSWLVGQVSFLDFRCVHASFYEGLLVCPLVSPLVGNKFFFKPWKMIGNSMDSMEKLRYGLPDCKESTNNL